MIHRETMARRMRDLHAVGLSSKYAEIPAAGYSLGQLFLRGKQDRSDPGSISGSQFATGRAWASLVRRHAQLMGAPNSSPQSPSGRMVRGGGGGGESSDDEDEVIAVRRKWSDCDYVIRAECAIHGSAVREILYSVCVSDLPLERMLMSSYGLLRIGLNALGRVI